MRVSSSACVRSSLRHHERTLSMNPMSVGYRASSRGCGMALLVGPVGGADEGPREDRPESERFALLAEPAELLRVHPAVDPSVLRRGLQVLADGDDVHADRAQVAHRL